MKRTSSKTANNAKYCMKYRNKNIETIREKDKERKRFEREYEKYCDEEKYEEKKRKDRERKRLAKERKLEGMEESSVIPLMDVLGILNRADDNDGETFQLKFDKVLTFSLFYKFIKSHKQYIFNKKITCLCEVCENTTLFGKGLNNACKSKDIPTDPHAIVEHYSCNSKTKECMMSSCVECKYHGLSIDDFRDEDDDVGDHEEENESSESDSDFEASDVVKYYQWKRGEDGYLTKMRIETDIDEALTFGNPWSKY